MVECHMDELTVDINMIACSGVGLCAHLAPEDIGLDAWGFPILLNGKIHSPDQVRRAASSCPRRALSVLTSSD
jgi:ferredoxin